MKFLVNLKSKISLNLLFKLCNKKTAPTSTPYCVDIALEQLVANIKSDVDVLAEAALLKYPLTIDNLGSKGIPGAYGLGPFEIKDHLGSLSISFKEKRLGTIKNEDVIELFSNLRSAAYFDEEEESRKLLFSEAFKEVGVT